MMRIKVGRNSRLLSLLTNYNNKAVASAIVLMAIILASSTVAVTPLFLQGKAFAGTYPGRNGQIAFTATRDGGRQQVYVMDPDGYNQQDISNSPGQDAHPNWSPDGSKIAFVSNKDTGGGNANSEIYKMNADGSGQTRLTNDLLRGNDYMVSRWLQDCL